MRKGIKQKTRLTNCVIGEIVNGADRKRRKMQRFRMR